MQHTNPSDRKPDPEVVRLWLLVTLLIALCLLALFGPDR